MKNERFQEYAKGMRFAVGALVVFAGYSLASGAFTSLSTVSSGSGLTASAWNAMVANLNDLNARTVPTGTVIAYNGTSCPTGWTEAAGSSVPAGPGGSATLNLRGQFVRGWNSSAAGIDPGRAFGSSQNGSLTATEVINGGNVGMVTRQDGATYTDAGPSTALYVGWVSGTLGSYANSYVRVVRPTNVALLYCVKD